MSAQPIVITGIAGQDGLYLAEALGRTGTPVVGTVRPGSNEADLVGVYAPHAVVAPLDVRDTDGFEALVRAHQPGWVVNLAAVSSVGRSWHEPELTHAVNGAAVRDMVRALGELGNECGFVQASSSEERLGQSPYATSKREARLAVEQARAAGLAGVVVTFFNHESPLRPTTFVTRKITRAAAEIALGRADHVVLGNLDIRRDWGFAGDYAAALLAVVTRAPASADLEIATGTSHSLDDLLTSAFRAAGLADVERYVHQDPDLMRPSDTPDMVGDATAARAAWGWQPTLGFEAMVEHMVHTDIRRLESGIEESVNYLYP